MRALVKVLIAIVLVVVALVVVVGPGGVVAGSEYPFGIGPWSSTGRYCQDMYEMNHFVDEWHHSDRVTLSPSQKVTSRAYEKVLTETGPAVPRAEFTVFYRSGGDVEKRMDREATLLNTWWDEHCAVPMMEVPASLGRTWSGLGSHAHFTHYPKNVMRIGNFFKVIE